MKLIKEFFYSLVLKLIDFAENFRDRKRKEALGIPSSVSIYKTTFIGNNISIGERTYLNEGCIISSGITSKVKIGSDCAIGRYVHIASKTHDLSQPTSTPEFPNLKEVEKDVYIGSGVWIGDKVYIGPGIRVGDYAIIGAHSVVTKNVDSFEIVGGVPTKHIRYNTEHIYYSKQY
jgi:acetyltransferase-like isoleucine patch superfamily enzyme